MGAAQRRLGIAFTGLAVVLAAGVSMAAEVNVTDADRTFRNFTRETATLAPNQVWVELRGLKVQDDLDPELTVTGQRLRDVHPNQRVQSLSGGIIDLLAAYGIGKNAEVGIDIPAIFESDQFKGGHSLNQQDMGDLLLYTKIQHPVDEHLSVGGGVELTLPSGDSRKGFGTGDLGINPVVSSRYTYGRFGVGANVGYTLYDGDTRDVFNYGAEGIMRGSELWAFRAEILGRYFTQGGRRFHDLTVSPGIDINISRNIIVRPEGLAGVTGTALDYGLGMGVAVVF